MSPSREAADHLLSSVRTYGTGSAISKKDRNQPEGDEGADLRGPLDKATLQDITTENERVRAGIPSPAGLTRIEGDQERHVDVQVVMVVTDRRVLFVSGANGVGSGSVDAGSLEYMDIAGVTVRPTDRGLAERVLEFSSTDGVRWQFPLPASDETVEAAVRHLLWIGEVRSRVVAAGNDVDLVAGEIADEAAAMDWEAAEAAYERARRDLDRLIGAVHRTTPVDAVDLAPEVTAFERTLESAYAALYIERSTSQLTLGQQLVENEDYEQARKVLQRAQELYEVAMDHAQAVTRRDAFMFGEQRELDHDLDRLAWEIEAVSAEPIRQAHEAKILATNTEDPEAAAEHWERAYRRYGDVLTLEWSDDERHFAGDREEVGREMADAAAALIGLHRELARSRWNDGVARHEDGAVKEALRLYTEAQEHLSRAFELAEEHDSAALEDIGLQLENIVGSLTRVRETATVELPAAREEGATATGELAERDDVDFGHPPEADAPAASETRTASRADRPGIEPAERYSADELRAIDTATEVTLGEGGERIGEDEPDAERTRETNPESPAEAAGGDTSETEDIVLNGDGE
jgi:tetratricopeptide (TPR) repeat protein